MCNYCSLCGNAIYDGKPNICGSCNEAFCDDCFDSDEELCSKCMQERFWKRMSQRLTMIKQAGEEICEKGILEEA